MTRILSSSAPLILVHGSIDSRPVLQHLEIAERVAHDALLYQRLDSEILDDNTALRLLAQGELGYGNIVVIGTPSNNRFAAWMLGEKRIPGQLLRYLRESRLIQST